jgi:predicted RNase H-like HicB family nuclease
MNYTIVVRRAASGRYLASCPCIPECHTQGDTYEEAIQNAKEALQLCIQYIREQGERLPEEVGSEKVLV